MVQCSLTKIELAYATVYGNWLILDEKLANRLNNGNFSNTTNKMASKFVAIENQMHNLRKMLPLTSKMYH